MVPADRRITVLGRDSHPKEPGEMVDSTPLESSACVGRRRIYLSSRQEDCFGRADRVAEAGRSAHVTGHRLNFANAMGRRAKR